MTIQDLGRIALTLGIIAGAGTAVAEGPGPDLTGVWSGKVQSGVMRGIQHHEPEATEPRFGNYELTFTLAIERQEGGAIVGTWSSPDHSETIFGVLRGDGETLILVDEDSHFDGLLLSPTTMELCLAETHDEAMGAWCLEMIKQDP